MVLRVPLLLAHLAVLAGGAQLNDGARSSLLRDDTLQQPESEAPHRSKGHVGSRKPHARDHLAMSQLKEASVNFFETTGFLPRWLRAIFLACSLFVALYMYMWCSAGVFENPLAVRAIKEVSDEDNESEVSGGLGFASIRNDLPARPAGAFDENRGNSDSDHSSLTSAQGMRLDTVKEALEDNKSDDLDDEACFGAGHETAFWAARGAVLRQSSGVDQAIVDLSRALREKPNDPVLWAKRGSARRRHGDLDGALKDYSEVLKLDPRDAVAWGKIAGIKMQLGDANGALGDYDRSLRLNPKDAFCLEKRAAVRQYLGDATGALSDYDRALRLDAKNTSARVKRAAVKEERGDVDGALADLKEAVSLAPGDAVPAAALDGLRQKLERDKKTQEAAAATGKSIDARTAFAPAPPSNVSRGIVPQPAGAVAKAPEPVPSQAPTTSAPLGKEAVLLPPKAAGESAATEASTEEPELDETTLSDHLVLLAALDGASISSVKARQAAPREPMPVSPGKEALRTLVSPAPAAVDAAANLRSTEEPEDPELEELDEATLSEHLLLLAALDGPAIGSLKALQPASSQVPTTSAPLGKEALPTSSATVADKMPPNAADESAATASTEASQPAPSQLPTTSAPLGKEALPAPAATVPDEKPPHTAVDSAAKETATAEPELNDGTIASSPAPLASSSVKDAPSKDAPSEDGTHDASKSTATAVPAEEEQQVAPTEEEPEVEAQAVPEGVGSGEQKTSKERGQRNGRRHRQRGGGQGNDRKGKGTGKGHDES